MIRIMSAFVMFSLILRSSLLLNVRHHSAVVWNRHFKIGAFSEKSLCAAIKQIVITLKFAAFLLMRMLQHTQDCESEHLKHTLHVCLEMHRLIKL